MLKYNFVLLPTKKVPLPPLDLHTVTEYVTVRYFLQAFLISFLHPLSPQYVQFVWQQSIFEYKSEQGLYVGYKKLISGAVLQ